MNIGIDFDNTMVCYDAVFHAVAREHGWVDDAVPARKDAVRNHLRIAGREDSWIGLQGQVYGRRIVEAPPFAGVLDFLRACRQAQATVCIISHKTRYPFRGEQHDLHHAALGWLAHHGLFNDASIGLSPRDVYLELTKEAKLARIAAAGCEVFIDDLPEFLGEAAFPAGVRRVLFDPNGQHVKETRFERLTAWNEAMALFDPLSLRGLRERDGVKAPANEPRQEKHQDPRPIVLDNILTQAGHTSPHPSPLPKTPEGEGVRRKAG
ncbi:MAG: hypothetical protein WD042_07160 [Phycisphaeraceae bacterium]